MCTKRSFSEGRASEREGYRNIFHNEAPVSHHEDTVHRQPCVQIWNRINNKYQTVVLHCCHLTSMYSILNSRLFSVYNSPWWTQSQSWRLVVSPQIMVFIYWIFIQITYNKCHAPKHTHTKYAQRTVCVTFVNKLMLCSHGKAGWNTPMYKHTRTQYHCKK